METSKRCVKLFSLIFILKKRKRPFRDKSSMTVSEILVLTFRGKLTDQVALYDKSAQEFNLRFSFYRQK